MQYDILATSTVFYNTCDIAVGFHANGCAVKDAKCFWPLPAEGRLEMRRGRGACRDVGR